MDFLAKAVIAVIPSCVKPIWKNITYPFNATDNVKALDAATETLKAIEADVKQKVEIANLQGLTQTNLVEDWFNKVELVKEEVAHINTEYEERSPCLRRKSLNCWSNYWISKNAAKKLKVVQELCEKGKFEEVATIRLPPRVQEFLIGSEVMSKEAADLQAILRYIDNDDDDIIGIWGMGGVGKTRLLQLVNNWHAQSSDFDVVIFITASRQCSVGKVQDELREKYGFGMGSDIGSKATIISNYLSNKNFLFLLDDLWEEIDLKMVGIPFPLGRVNQFKRKVVLTTRVRSVCYSMDVKEERMVMVSCLNLEDAFRLFLESVRDETIENNSEKKYIAQNIVSELDGLPLALITVGRAMRSKKHPREWEHAFNLLHNSLLNKLDEEKIYYSLKFSYDSLKSERLKECFLACSLWPEDYLIEKEKLIELWHGLGIVDHEGYDTFGMLPLYGEGYDIIGELISACLLEEEGLDKVKMHDVIRDMALWIACDFGRSRDKWIVRNGIGVHNVLLETNSWFHVERATLLNPGNSSGSIPREAKNLSFLKVHSNRIRVQLLIENLKYFHALTFLDLSNCHLENFPIDSTNLISLRYFNLSNNRIKLVPKELGHLTDLEHLSLRNNNIVSFPEGVIWNLPKLQILDFYEINGWKPTNYMTWLVKAILENFKGKLFLGITLHSEDQWDRLTKSMEVSLSVKLRALSLYICDEMITLPIPRYFFNESTQDFLKELSFGEMIVKAIKWKNDCNYKLNKLEKLSFDSMEFLQEIIWERPAEHSLPGLPTVQISRCRKLKDLSWTYYLPSLKRLHLIECGGIFQLIITEQERLGDVFPSLTHLVLINLPVLKLISATPIKFPSLEYICIQDCPKLTRKLPFNSNTFPSKLKTIKAGRDWWQQLEWEDDDFREKMQRLFEEI